MLLYEMTGRLRECDADGNGRVAAYIDGIGPVEVDHVRTDGSTTLLDITNALDPEVVMGVVLRKRVDLHGLNGMPIEVTARVPSGAVDVLLRWDPTARDWRLRTETAELRAGPSARLLFAVGRIAAIRDRLPDGIDGRRPGLQALDRAIEELEAGAAALARRGD